MTPPYSPELRERLRELLEILRQSGLHEDELDELHDSIPVLLAEIDRLNGRG